MVAQGLSRRCRHMSTLSLESLLVAKLECWEIRTSFEHLPVSHMPWLNASLWRNWERYRPGAFIADYDRDGDMGFDPV